MNLTPFFNEQLMNQQFFKDLINALTRKYNGS